MLLACVPHNNLSSSAKAGDPVRRGLPVLSSASLEYWVTRRSLSSGGHSADPVAGDDTDVSLATSDSTRPAQRRGRRFAEFSAIGARHPAEMGEAEIKGDLGDVLPRPSAAQLRIERRQPDIKQHL